MADDDLVPIEEVARRFGIRASALRYYERRGLLQPSARRAGRRWYGPAERRRLAIIGFWQQSGQLSLDDIAAILAGPSYDRGWKQIVRDRRAALDEQIKRMQVARDFLEHALTCPRDHSLDGCPYYEAAIGDEDGIHGAWRPRLSSTAIPGMTTRSRSCWRPRIPPSICSR
jgi:MerR family transcriptional regulator, copper efflux regulator